MSRSSRRSPLLTIAISLCLAAGACSDDDEPTTKGDAAAATGDGGASAVGMSTGSWMVYDLSTDAGAQENPATGIAGSATITKVGAKTQFKLSVSGLKPNREYGSHVHVAPCDQGQAGGHYQHTMRPADAAATDPAYANAMNEVWLDFTTDATGKATSETTADWTLDVSRAKAVIIHTMKTGPGGAAGTKLACINLAYN